MKATKAPPVSAAFLRQGVVTVIHPSLAPDPQALQTLRALAHSGLLSAPPVALPDLHFKPALETPSSTATATRDTLVLGLSSPSPNCGMALARTGLYIDDVDSRTMDALFDELLCRLPLKRASPVLSPDEMTDVMVRGARSAIDRYGLDPSTPEYMDQRGNALAPDVDPQTILQAVPAALRQMGSLRFGQVGKGNHFLELQTVDEIQNQAVAEAWGLKQGQLVVMYHADSDYLGAFVGRLYAHRKKNNWRGRLYEWRIKLPFHMTTGRPARALHRVHYHIIPRRWMPIPAASEEGRRTLLALQAASNYAFANRLAILALLRDAVHAVWGTRCDSPSLLWDAPHNGIRRETVGGQEMWVHRHNAARVEPPSQTPAGSPFAGTGHPVLLPGTDRISSYLCVAGEGAAHTLHSVDHGAGHSALQLGHPMSGSPATRLYTYEHGLTETRPHLSDDGLQAVLSVLQTRDIAHPVARLRPLAVLKGRA
jgi:RNA-splicing ligase RtcB